MKRLLILVLTFFAFNLSSQAQIHFIEIKPTEVPVKFYKGKIVAVKCWGDQKGQHVVILSETGVVKETAKDKEFEDSRRADLYAYHYLVGDSTWYAVWRVWDYVPDCEVDVICEFIRNSLSITDLDKDGEMEVAFLYRLSCRGDTSPDGLKLIMYENKTKYAIRGEMTVIAGEKYGGEKIVDKSLNNAPKGFLEYANKLWDKYKTFKY